MSKTGRISSEDLDAFSQMEKQRHENLITKLGWDARTHLMTQSYEVEFGQKPAVNDGSLYGTWRGEGSKGGKALSKLKVMQKFSSSEALKAAAAQPEAGAAAPATAPQLAMAAMAAMRPPSANAPAQTQDSKV